jgi:hypothetical protein|tara:strand:+ start:5553 stop:5789 length:237 start_codon:yes stop_codon:yes gene_type:complete
MGDIKKVQVQTRYEKEFLIFGLRYFTVTSNYTQHIMDFKIKKLLKFRISNILGMVSDVQIQIYKVFINLGAGISDEKI